MEIIKNILLFSSSDGATAALQVATGVRPPPPMHLAQRIGTEGGPNETVEVLEVLWSVTRSLCVLNMPTRNVRVACVPADRAVVLRVYYQAAGSEELPGDMACESCVLGRTYVCSTHHRVT